MSSFVKYGTGCSSSTTNVLSSFAFIPNSSSPSCFYLSSQHFLHRTQYMHIEKPYLD